MKFFTGINSSLLKKIVIYLMGIFISTLIVSMIILSLIIKNRSETTTSDHLEAYGDLLYTLVENSYDTFKQNLVEEAEHNLTMCEKIYRQNPAGAEGVLRDLLLSTKVGKSGYIYCVDSYGVIKVHPKKELINTNIFKHQFIQDTIKNKKGFIEYSWANPGEKTPRSKAVGIAYFRPLDWHIIVSSYLDEFLDTHTSDKTDKDKDHPSLKKKLRGLKIGDQGYAYLMNGKGDLILHPKLEGKNISHFDFIKHILDTKNGVHTYDWEGSKKLVAYKYFKPLDLIIAAGSYYDDFLGSTFTAIVITAFIVTILSSIAVFFLVMRIVTKIIINPITHVTRIAEAIRSGDYSAQIEQSSQSSKDEIGKMMDALSGMLENLKGIIETLADNIEHLSASSEKMEGISVKMSSMSQDQAASMEETAASLEETQASMEQIASRTETQYNNVDLNAERMGRMAEDARISYDEAIPVSSLMSKTASEASNGEKDLNRMVEEMQNIKESTLKIAEIIKIISDISEQVNLLSLNAAIEAARAGDHGRGFAVVAAEISKLADETASSAKLIANLVKEGNTQVDSGTEIVNRTAQTFHQIIESIEKSTVSMSKFSETLKLVAESSSEARRRTDGIKQIANEISVAANEQMSTTREISKTIEKVNYSSQELVTFADIILRTAEEIGIISKSLQEQLKKFKQ